MRLPLAAPLQSRDGTTDKDGHIANGYVEMIGQTAVVYKRPGISDVASLGAGRGQGIVDVGGQLYAAIGGALFAADVFIPTSTFTALNAGGSLLANATVEFDGYLWQFVRSGFDHRLYRTDAYTNAWTQIGAEPYGEYEPGPEAVVVFNGSMWLIAPMDYSPSGGTKLVLKSTNGVTWTTVTSAAAFPTMGTAHCVTYNDRLWILGGEVAGAGGGGAIVNEVWSSLDGSNWTQVNAAAAWGSRKDYRVAVAFGKMWVIGGCDSGETTFYNDCWSSLDGVTWTQETAAAAFAVRSNFCLANSAGGLCIVGGRTTGPAGLNDVYRTFNGITWTQVAASSNIATAKWVSPNSYWSNHGVALNGVMGAVTNGNTTGGITYYAPTTSGGYSVGSVPVVGQIDFEKTFDSAQVFVHGTSAAYGMASNALTQVTDAQYPALTVPGAVYLNGRFYVMEPDGTIWNSAEDDCMSWAGTDFVNAEFSSDAGVCLAKYQSYVVAFGETTTEMFWAGNTAANGSPLLPVDSSVILVGCAAAGSVAQADGSLVWMAQKKGQGASFQKGRFIAMLTGTGSYRVLSDPDVDRILDADDLAAVYSTVLGVAGHTFYCLTLVSSGLTLVYDFGSEKSPVGLWYLWTRRATGSPVTLDSVTSSGLTATATKAAHGFSDGDPVTIAGATPAGYNGTFNVRVASSSTFTYVLSAALASPATGTITATGTTESYFPITASCAYNGEQVFLHETDGKVYAMDSATLADAGVFIDLRARLPNWDGGSDGNKTIPWVDVISDRASANVMLRCSDDDYQNWSYYRLRSLSGARTRLNRYGQTKRRAFELRHTDSVAFRGIALEFEPGA